VPTFEQTIEVAAPLEEAFLYVADFRTAAEWDPGIVQSRRVNNGPIGEGATYDVTAVFRGNRIPLRCELVEYEQNRRLLFHAAGAKARSTDELRFEPVDDGTRIAYRAVLSMKGLSRLAEPFLGRTWTATGARALAGLKAKLDGSR